MGSTSECGGAGYLRDDESAPAAVLLDVAFPSAEWDYIRWALAAQGVPQSLVDALLAMYGPTEVEVYFHCKPTARRMVVTRGIRPASGTVWALHYDLWAAVPRDHLRPAVFADEFAVALRNVFRDLCVLRRALGVVRVVTGLGANPRKSGGQLHSQAVHTGPGHCLRRQRLSVSGVGKYLGFVRLAPNHSWRGGPVSGPDSCPAGRMRRPSGCTLAESPWRTAPTLSLWRRAPRSSSRSMARCCWPSTCASRAFSQRPCMPCVRASCRRWGWSGLGVLPHDLRRLA